MLPASTTKLNLGDIEETLLLPLWGRATISRDHPSFFYDEKAVEVVERIDYDFTTLDDTLRYVTHITHAARARQIDDKIRSYIAEHPKASVINLGAGLDTAFYRVDNGAVHWYDIDLPSVTALRSELLPPAGRTTYIADSLLNSDWFATITQSDNGVFMFAAGVLMYIEEPRVRALFLSLADAFPNAEIVFDTQSRLAKRIGDVRLGKVGMRGSTTKWACTDARTIARWDDRIVVVDQFPVFDNIPRDRTWSAVTKLWMDLADRCNMRTIVHLRL